MSSLSNDQGRGYEFACLNTLAEEIAKIRSVKVIQNSSYFAAENAWNTLSDSIQDNFKVSSRAAVEAIFELEPRIVEDGNDTLELMIQQDQKGEEGDVRDVLIIRRNISWEIGLSLKHNHFAVKHSRLSHKIDFGRVWYDIPCSQQYWDEVLPIFKFLDECKTEGVAFNQLADKEEQIYVPILNAFMDEIRLHSMTHPEMPGKLVEYLLGKYDFYKVVSMDSALQTIIQTFNVHGTLNLDGVNDKKKPNRQIPVVSLPTRIVQIEYKPNSKNTLEMYMDGGWQFSFRIHNAATKCEPSLKFDIQIVGMPTQIITITQKWR